MASPERVRRLRGDDWIGLNAGFRLLPSSGTVQLVVARLLARDKILAFHSFYCREGANRRYVDTDYTVTCAPALASLQRPGASVGAEPEVLSVGLSRYRDPRLRKLALAELEASAVSRLLNISRSPLLGPQATLDGVFDALPSASVLHFACHATWALDPNQSALQLWSAAPGRRQELTAEGITERFDLSRTRLATLSACESGVPEHFFAPNEYAGLPGAFLRAGAHGVISSLWAVHDLASLLLWTSASTAT